MDQVCTPTVVTAALFVALLFLDLFRRNFYLLQTHAVFGVIATALMQLLCQNTSSMVAWGILTIPFVTLILGWVGIAMKSMSTKDIPYRIGPVSNPIATGTTTGTAASTTPIVPPRTCGACGQPRPQCSCLAA